MNTGCMKKVFIISIILFFLVLVLFISYSGWNAASPTKTCSGCHEITHAVDLWTSSSHRNIACKECHGTALSEGIHSLKEKGSMLFHHSGKLTSDDIRISEDQRQIVMERCKSCHQAEYARWNSGGHSMNYSDVFLNTSHNKTETIYEDCLRCHGMFFDKGTVQDIVEPLDKTGPWKLKISALAHRPAIPCFACHQVHQAGFPVKRPDPGTPSTIHYSRVNINPASFYYRRDSTYFPMLSLNSPEINFEHVTLKVSKDPNQNLCIQCHSPNAFNMAGTGDDRTPRGVHEGISCLGCHDSHSNSALSSCKNCHPAISNCKLDVEKMNTSFKDQSSKNNIHFVSCTDCHIKGRPAKPANL
jgi:hypothetical protein